MILKYIIFFMLSLIGGDSDYPTEIGVNLANRYYNDDGPIEAIIEDYFYDCEDEEAYYPINDTIK